MASIRARQAEAIYRMLDLNRAAGGDAASAWQEPWKVLVYDRACQDVISPLLRVGDLRNRGITLHLLIGSEREPVPDVPAIYFVMPTAENVVKIGEDCARRLYDSYHVNFAAPVSRELLEELASLTLRAEAVSQVSQVVDQHLGYISLEDELVDLNVKSSFQRLNDPASTDANIEALLEQISTAIFSVLATLGAVPIIRCPRGGAAQMVADLLCRRVRDALQSGANFFADGGSSSGFQRPVLILTERSADMGVVLQHPWSYRALCHDILGMRLNRLTCADSAEEGGKKQTHTYNLERSDAFWQAQAGSPFPAVAEAVDSAIQQYRQEVDAINANAGASNGAVDIHSSLDHSTRQLQAAMSVLPELQDRKRIIDMHTNVATALLHLIRNSSLDSFVSAEEAVLARSISASDKATVENLITAGTAGSAQDRLRLLSLYFVHCSPPEAELQRLVGALRTQGVDVRPLAYLQKMAAFRNKVATKTVTDGGRPGVMSSVFNFADKASASLRYAYALLYTSATSLRSSPPLPPQLA
ncbi:Sec1-like protein [Pavlovales sp. CCMP2436]|nr:Sec1-like protein [Pavlovales sp. CCMP2436]